MPEAIPEAYPQGRHRPWLHCAPLLLFILLGTAVFWNARGDDLASSYVGCRVLSFGGGASLYSYDPVNFASIKDPDPAWAQAAARGGYGGWLHPYVQTPLWAWLLHPLCEHTQWPAFKHLFVVLSLCSMAGFVFLVARYWTPRLFTPIAIASILLALSFSEPFLFAMELVQTHALVLFLTIAGLILAQRDQPVAAGLCVACAAAVKITPAILLVYWLANRRWRTALSLLVWSVVLLAATRLIAGASLFHDFTTSLHRVSQVLLVSENNQSLAAWYMNRFFTPDEIFDVNAFVLPTALRLLSTALMVICSAAGGLLDLPVQGHASSLSKAENSNIPYGAGITLIAMTVFAPIAWTHYFIVMTIPLMMLTQAALERKPSRVAWVITATTIAAAVLLYRPLAPDVINMELSDYAVLRGTFYAAALCLIALLALSWRSRAVITSR